MNKRVVGALALILLFSGCVVRTQDFHCVREDDTKVNFELRMSPTSLEIKEVTYVFHEEKGAERIYKHKGNGHEVRFNPSSGQLLLSETAGLAWKCERYEPY
ncbi:MAG: hypothetical protein ACO24G_06225 [Burkholderiaceae bacterium]|jgi:hypothetical protein